MPPSITRHLLQNAPTESLFDCLTDTVFFIKDTDGRYVVVNDTLAIRCGRQSKSQLLGYTPSEIMGKLLGQGYESQDQLVLKDRATITDQLEMHIYANKSVGWCVTNKRPILAIDGTVIGLTGVSQDLRPPDMTHDDFSKISSLLSHVKENLSKPLTVKGLSKLAALTPYQLDRRIYRIFGLTTGQWVMKQRLDLARHQLSGSQTSIAEIALNIGYSDQSTFARQFHKTAGLTPSKFRKLTGLKDKR